MIYQISSGLAFQHSKHIVHRDLKLANVLLTEEGAVKIADYGCFVVLDYEGQEFKKARGTPKYTSKEAWNGRLYTKSDIYCLGAMFHELCYL